jgi:hypothetical protein
VSDHNNYYARVRQKINNKSEASSSTAPALCTSLTPKKRKKLSKLAESETLLMFIQEMLGSNLRWTTDYPDWSYRQFGISNSDYIRVKQQVD